MKKVFFPKVSSWGQKAVDELLKFPNSRHDDFVDTVTQALRRFREGGFIAHPEDYEDESDRFAPQHVYY